MIRYVVEYLPVVESDLGQIIDWYNNQQPDLGDKFLDHFKKAITHIHRHPLMHGVRNQNSRFRHLDRFPYKVAFKVIEERIVVFGVFHDKRNPQIIRKRLR